MLTPIMQYHGRDPEAILHPVENNLIEYEWYLGMYFGFGVQSMYRGWYLFNGPKSKELVVRYVKWFKTYRGILTSDIIHIKRANGRDIDAIMHVNPNPKETKERALLM